MSTELERLRKLPVAEKLQIVEGLWDDISQSDEPVVVADAVRVEVSQRSAEMAADPELGLTREEVWQQVGRSDGE